MNLQVKGTHTVVIGWLVANGQGLRRSCEIRYFPVKRRKDLPAFASMSLYSSFHPTIIGSHAFFFLVPDIDAHDYLITRGGSTLFSFFLFSFFFLVREG